MIYLLSNEYEISKARDYLEKCIENGWNIEIRHICKQRTSLQNRFAHAIFSYFGSQVGLPMQDVKQDIFKKLVNPDIFRLEPIIIGERKIERWRSISDLNTAEMTTAIERFRNFCASEMGIYISTPDDENFLLYCEKIAQQNKDFL